MTWVTLWCFEFNCGIVCLRVSLLCVSGCFWCLVCGLPVATGLIKFGMATLVWGDLGFDLGCVFVYCL